MARGRFITFEGGEGVGKSTQARLLAERLGAAGIVALTTREPGGTAFAEQVRTLVLTPAHAPASALAEALLFSSARADHLDQVIRPALARGAWVICDRFADSTRAYQGAAGGVEPASITVIEDLVLADTRPDVTVVLDLDPRVGLARADTRRGAQTPGAFVASDTFEGRTLAFHDRLRQGFLDIAAREPHRVAVIDAFQNQLAIADAVWAAIVARIGNPVPAGGA